MIESSESASVFRRIADNGETVISTPELPPRCIDKGIAGSSLAAQLLVTKCVDHNPLYRFQEQVRRYCDYDIPYSTISGWFSKGAFWLSSLVPALQSRILNSGYFQIDESTIKVYDRAHKRRYILSRWNVLTVFHKDGRVELSNNLVENRFRKLALGRRNWLFTKSEDGAKNLAAIYSVLGTCELNGINPYVYLCDLLEKLPARNSNDIDDLLPMNWKPSELK